MKLFKICFAILLAGLIVVLMPQSASAHVLLIDRQANIAAVLHVNPDDDPVAGQPSQLFFDVQDNDSQVRVPYSAYELAVTNEADATVVVRMQSNGSTVSADYTFPSQGLYRLSLRSASTYNGPQKVSLDTSLRISRGEGLFKAEERYPWATAGMYIGAVALIMLMIQAVNNRKSIVAYSHF